MTIDAIKADIAAKMSTKMEATATEAEAIMNREVTGYYGAVPKYYKWTGILKTSPEPVVVSGGGLSYSMEAKLNTGLSWPTGGYDGEEVLDATNEGHSGTLGNHGYWERSVQQIIAAANANFSSF